MMHKKLVIQNSCRIAKSTVWLNQQPVFANVEAEKPGLFLKCVYNHFETAYPKYFKMDKLSKLGFLAADILIKNSPVFSSYAPKDIGLIMANSASSLDTDLHYQETINDPDNYYPSPSLFVYTLPNIVMGEICIKHHIQGENNFFISSQAQLDFLQPYVQQLFDEQMVKCVLFGWVELLGEAYDARLLLITEADMNRHTAESTIFETKSLEALFAS